MSEFLTSIDSSGTGKSVQRERHGHKSVTVMLGETSGFFTLGFVF